MWDLFLSFYAVAAAPAFASSAEDHTWVQTGQTLFSSSNGPLPLKLESQANEWSYYPCTGITRFTNSSPTLLMGFSRAWWARWKCSSFKGTSHTNSIFQQKCRHIFICMWKEWPKVIFHFGMHVKHLAWASVCRLFTQSMATAEPLWLWENALQLFLHMGWPILSIRVNFAHQSVLTQSCKWSCLQVWLFIEGCFFFFCFWWDFLLLCCCFFRLRKRLSCFGSYA